ncbi:aminotransferase class V-fold PLP-dependent enzyme [Dehalobacterium formicoaceticum]|uniref:cysteine desulfurase n=1 Tax=Dehalobacterium formicoaceticum TaxID=51515 RepID=A0ABT1Y7M8_9FIRM|nr:aminotransferase class V-fold PLP-dependent enzyme [Dehalobacterium formicoaceticum]MCR6546890.1 aminotransferase class V-fold PLP-dependent enzyme [Dehalobacterium formicoaceticum]
MIYFDNAATSWPKPEAVYQAVDQCLRKKGANPSRSGHHMSLMAGQIVWETRSLVAQLFNIPNPERVVFTCNATEGLNLGLKGILHPGDHVITSSLEHNSVTRPLATMEEKGIKVTKLTTSISLGLDPHQVAAAIQSNTRLIILSHASNVTGVLHPIDAIGKLAREKGVLLMVDAAQTAGSFPIDVQAMDIDLLAFTGHKGLLGPQGTGGLYIRDGLSLTPLKEGGTGGNSEPSLQPEACPERYESGTLNTPGLAGLGAGIRFILQIGLAEIREQERVLTERLLGGLESMPNISLFGPELGKDRAPLVSFNIGNKEPGEVSFILDKVFNIAARPGLHCAPDAHRTMGTFPQGTVRLSLGYFNTFEEVDVALEAISAIAANRA